MRHTLLFLLLLAATAARAQGPGDSGTYYAAADGKKGSALKTALRGIIASHTNLGYNGLWTAYKTTDVRPDGKLRDWYSQSTAYVIGGSKQGANYKKEGDSYNREHLIPQSWFNEALPMKADAYHVVPTDGYVNNRRGNYPFGETNGGTYKSNGAYCKLGASTTAGYSGTVFEPGDDVKGDIARAYFYMMTCYEDKVASWASNGTANTMLAGNKYPALKQWALNMLLRWAKDDPVDDVEQARNEAVHKLQHNRNPYIDYPGLEQYVWGTLTAAAFSYDNYSATGTGIDDIEAEPASREPTAADIVYDLLGRPRGHWGDRLPPGIYVCRGRKVAVGR